jgi:hypothetical protein
LDEFLIKFVHHVDKNLLKQDFLRIQLISSQLAINWQTLGKHLPKVNWGFFKFLINSRISAIIVAGGRFGGDGG